MLASLTCDNSYVLGQNEIQEDAFFGMYLPPLKTEPYKVGRIHIRLDHVPIKKYTFRLQQQREKHFANSVCKDSYITTKSIQK